MAVIAVPETLPQAAAQTSPRRPAAPGTRWRRGVAGVLLACVLGLGLMYADVRLRHNPIYVAAETVPAAPVAIVFGAGYNRRGLSAILSDRVAVGAALYRAGKARKLLLTGDNSTPTHNEPEAMCQAALRLGVPRRDIVLDHAGFRTYDSLYRARDVFGVRRAILVTQTYHLPRALYIARALGIDAVGVSADRRDYGSAMPHYLLREVFAVENAWLEVNISHPLPRTFPRSRPY